MIVQYVEAQSSNGVKQLCRLNSPIKAKPVSSHSSCSTLKLCGLPVNACAFQ